jgi:hypothetical protein
MKTRTNLIVVDNFYDNPDAIRSQALTMEYTKSKKHYPGSRAPTELTQEALAKIKSALKSSAGNVSGQYTLYQLALEHEESWIHHDGNRSWAGVIFLTPDAPVSSGTAIYRHRDTGFIVCPSHDPAVLERVEADVVDHSKWEIVDIVGNVYNRLILYRADQYHMSQPYFGTSITNGRLFQVIFIGTDY